MAPEERDQYIVSQLVRVAPGVTGIAGGLLLYAMWKSTPLSPMFALYTIIFSLGMFTFSYAVWQGRVGYAWVVPGLFLALEVGRVSQAKPELLWLVLQEASVSILVYFLVLWVLTPWLRKRNFLPPVDEAWTAQSAIRGPSPQDKVDLRWLLWAAPLVVLLASGGLLYTAQAGGWLLSSTSWSLGAYISILSVGLAYVWWRKSPGGLALLPPAIFLGQSLAYVLPFPEESLKALLELQRFSLKMFVFFLLLWCLKPHLRRQGWLS